MGKAISTEARVMYSMGQSGLTFFAPNVNIFRYWQLLFLLLLTDIELLYHVSRGGPLSFDSFDVVNEMYRLQL